MIVYVEKKVLEDPAITHDDSFGPVKKKFCTFSEGTHHFRISLKYFLGGASIPEWMYYCQIPWE